MCLSCEDIARHSCAMVPRSRLCGDFLGSCISSEPHAAGFRPASMVDIQSPTAEIRRGKKEERKKPQDENIMVCSITQGDHKNCFTALLSYTLVYM